MKTKVNPKAEASRRGGNLVSMRTRNVRKSTLALIVSEVTVAAQLLFLLPSGTVQAATVPETPVEENSGEAALAKLKIERAAPTPQEPVEVNKTVPDVEPPPAYPTFSPIPTDGELTKARVFGEPLIPEDGDSNDAENQALAQAITTYLYGGDSEALEPLEGVVTSFPKSRWRVAIQANVGSWYRRKGYFTRAQRNLSEAWRLGKDSQTEGVKRLAEFAAGELMVIYMQFGQVDPLEALTAEFAGRRLRGSITEKLSAAQATVWGLRNDHGNAIPSAAVALERMRLGKHNESENSWTRQNPEHKKRAFQRHPELDRFPATINGASLAEMKDLADATDLGLQMARRVEPNAAVPIPSVVHLKAGHFATIAEERDGRFRLDDPLLGGEVWLSKAAFEEEISGFFLVERGRLPPGWRNVAQGESEMIRGKCVYATPRRGDNTVHEQKKSACRRTVGMAWFTFHTMLANLSIVDNPVGYATAFGPSVRFILTYNHREAGQPSSFPYSNLGSRWSHSWMAYIEDDPSAVGDPVVLYPAGGGNKNYSGFTDGISSPQQDTRSIMRIVSTDPIKYELDFPDGSKETYAQSDGASAAPRRVFLTEKNDRHGNSLTLTYDSQLRLTAVTDASDLVTTLSYELETDPLKITKITDPYNRSAVLDYNHNGELIRITDVIGITSEFEYGPEDFIRALVTPYGKTTFRHGVGRYNTTTNRWVEATDPLGGVQRVEHLLNGAPIDSSDQAVPIGFTGNSNLDTHVSVYYSKLQMDQASTQPPDPETGSITRWRLASSLSVSGYQVQSMKEPLENRVWYEHVGESFSNGTGPDGRPARTGRVLSGSSSQVTSYEYNSKGQVERLTDPLGRETTFDYDSNEVDVLHVKQKNGSDYDLIASYVYNSQHQPVTVTGASGETTTFSYNAAGQLSTVVVPARADVVEDRTASFTYGTTSGRLEKVVLPGGETLSQTYDTYGRVRTRTSTGGHTETYDYDSFDRLTRTTFPDGTYRESYYDRLDRAGIRDRLGRWTRFVRDRVGRVVATVDPAGRLRRRVFCPCGTLLAMVDGNGNATSYEYDIQGRKTKETREDGSFKEFVYDEIGRLETTIDAKEQEVRLVYALDDQITSKSFVNEEHTTADVTYSYSDAQTGQLDPYGRLRGVTDGAGTTTYNYHPAGELGAGKLSSVDGPFANDVITYDFDERGQLVSRALDGVETTWDYDEQGRVLALNDPIGTFLFEYDGRTERVAAVHYPNGQRATFAYFDNAGDKLLQQIHHADDEGDTISRFDYTYESSQNMKTWTQQVGSSPAWSYTFEHDRAGQLRAATAATTGQSPTIVKRYRYSYDSAGNRLSEQVDDTVTSFTYNNMNRLVSQAPGGALDFRGSINEPSSVTVAGSPADVNSSNEFVGNATIPSGTSTVEIAATDSSGNTRTDEYEVQTSGASITLSYDATGNVTSKAEGGNTTSYEWDAEARLIRVLEGSAEAARYVYGAERRRLQKVVGTTTITYVHAGHALLEERSSAGTTTRYIHGPGVDWPLAQVVDGTASYYVLDHLRSVRQVTDSTGQPTLTRDYDMFGVLLDGEDESGYSFTGREWDADSQLYYYRARFYDPKSARFMSEDPAAVGPNLYSYVRNRPIESVDPFGLVDLNLLSPERDIKAFLGMYMYDKPGWFTVAAHGSNLETGSRFVYDDRNMQKIEKTPMGLARMIGDVDWNPEDVSLISCNTAIASPLTGQIYAQELANALCVTVEAPPELIYYLWKESYEGGPIVDGFVGGPNSKDPATGEYNLDDPAEFVEFYPY